MLNSRRGRLVAVVTLLGLLLGTMVWLGMTVATPALGSYPTQDGIERGSVTAGEAVVVTGTVVETDPLVLEASVDFVVDGTYEQREIRVAITEISESYPVGQNIQVFGTYVGERTVSERNTITIGSLPYTYAVSFFAGVWVLARLLVYWRFDPSNASFYRRHNPRGLLARLQRLVSRRGDQ